MDEWLISLQTINKKARNYAYLVSQLTIKLIRRQAQPQKKVQDAQTAIESQIFSKQTMCSLCLQNLPYIKIVLKIIGWVWLGYIYLQQFSLIQEKKNSINATSQENLFCSMLTAKPQISLWIQKSTQSSLFTCIYWPSTIHSPNPDGSYQVMQIQRLTDIFTGRTAPNTGFLWCNSYKVCIWGIEKNMVRKQNMQIFFKAIKH